MTEPLLIKKFFNVEGRSVLALQPLLVLVEDVMYPGFVALSETEHTSDGLLFNIGILDLVNKHDIRNHLQIQSRGFGAGINRHCAYIRIVNELFV